MKLVNKLSIIIAAGAISFGSSNVVYSKDTIIQKTLKNFCDTSTKAKVVDKKEKFSIPKKSNKDISV